MARRTEVVHDVTGTLGARRSSHDFEPWIITDTPCVPITVGHGNSGHYLVVTADDEVFAGIRRREGVGKKQDELEGFDALFDVKAVSDLAGYDPTSGTPPAEWPDFSAPIEAEFCCPKCGYEWRGSPKPSAKDVEEATT